MCHGDGGIETSAKTVANCILGQARGWQTKRPLATTLGDGGLEGADILVMISDNTLARIEQQRLLYSNKMETIGQLAAGVAHELRTPLGTIRNSSYLLQREHGEDADVRSIALHSIDSSVERASSIIENLLKFSRLTNEKKEWVDLEKSILESVFPSRMRMDEQGILLDIICEPGTKLYINSESLNHILANLIQNAVDAMPNGGRLTIHCRWNSANKNIIQIQITDEGIGIKKDAIEKLFGPFYTTKAIGKGTGLGLYIAYSEIQKAKGDITVESEAGRGTTFTITIPDGSEHT